jgi:anti-sigma-K factor RskA
LKKEDIISSGLLELYALGISSSEESAQVQEWVKQYPELKQEIDDIELSLETYAQANAIEPSPGLKDKILASIASSENAGDKATYAVVAESATAKVYRIPAFFKFAVAAAILLLIGSIAFNYFYYSKYKSVNNQLQLARQQMEQERQANLAMKNDINVMSDKNSQPVVLNGTPRAPEALAKIYWMKNTGQVYVDPSNLPDAPSGKQYQLWAIVGGKPVDAGMITTEKGTYHIQKMKSFGHAEAFAITLEKAGGSPTPTMDQMYVIAKVS